MNEWESFRRLAARARRDRPPRLDVTARVLGTIHGGEELRAERLSMLVLSGLSLVAASVVVALVIDAWLPLTDPLAGLFPWITVLP